MKSRTGINIELGHFPGAFLLYFCCPRVEVAGNTYEKPWGKHFIKLPEGKHTVKVFFKYIGNPRCGENQLHFKLNEGEVKRIKFFMPPLMTVAGKLTFEN